jgi:hypothetical protein
MVAERDAADVLGEPVGGRLTVAEAIRRSLATPRVGRASAAREDGATDGATDGAAVGGDPQAPSVGDPSWAHDRSVIDWLRGALPRR